MGNYAKSKITFTI